MAEKFTQLSSERQLACMMGQHEWSFDDDDIRFRVCVYCETVEYYGKEVADGKQADAGTHDTSGNPDGA